MTTLRELVEVGDRLIITGEAPAIDGGTLDVFNKRIAEMAQWVDAMNATDNTAAHAHASNVACAIAIAQTGVEPILQVVCKAEAAYQLGLEQARHALSLPGVRGLHLTDFRHDGALSRLCRDLDIPLKEERRAHAHRPQLTV